MIALSIIALLFVSLVVSCAAVIGLPKPDFRESRIEVASPNGRRVAILDRYIEGEYFLSAGWYSTLTLSEEGRVEFVGKLSFGPAPQWLSDERLLVTIYDTHYNTQMPKIKSRVLGVDIVLHLEDGARFYNSHAGPNVKQACERQRPC